MPDTSAGRLSSSPGAPVSPSSSDAEYDKLPVSQTCFTGLKLSKYFLIQKLRIKAVFFEFTGIVCSVLH